MMGIMIDAEKALEALRAILAENVDNDVMDNRTIVFNMGFAAAIRELEHIAEEAKRNGKP